MKPKLILCLALGLSGGLFGCCTVDHHSTNAKQSQPDLYLHIVACPDSKSLQSLLSARIRLSTDFDIPMADGHRLKGRIEPHNGKFFVDFRPDYFGTNVFNGVVEFNEVNILLVPSDGVLPENVQFFVLSSNSSSKSALKQVADFLPVETLTARQLAEVKKNFHLMRPGMTEAEVFSMLGLAGYQHRLYPATISRSNDWSISDYQLAENEVLQLFLDNTGMKTMKIPFFADGGKLEFWDYDNSKVTNRLVIKAELDTVVSFSNSPSIWRPVLKWP